MIKNCLVCPSKRKLLIGLMLLTLIWIYKSAESYVIPQVVFWVNPDAYDLTANIYAPAITGLFSSNLESFLEIANLIEYLNIIFSVLLSYIAACVFDALLFRGEMAKNEPGARPEQP